MLSLIELLDMFRYWRCGLLFWLASGRLRERYPLWSWWSIPMWCNFWRLVFDSLLDFSMGGICSLGKNLCKLSFSVWSSLWKRMVLNGPSLEFWWRSLYFIFYVTGYGQQDQNLHCTGVRHRWRAIWQDCKLFIHFKHMTYESLLPKCISHSDILCRAVSHSTLSHSGLLCWAVSHSTLSGVLLLASGSFVLPFA